MKISQLAPFSYGKSGSWFRDGPPMAGKSAIIYFAKPIVKQMRS
jgi:hypothetical protein